MNRILFRALAIGAAAPLTLALGLSPADAAVGNQNVHEEFGGRVVVLTCNHPLYPGGHDAVGDHGDVGFLGYEARIVLRGEGDGPFGDDVRSVYVAATKRHTFGEFRRHLARLDNVRVEMFDTDIDQTKIDIDKAAHKYDRTRNGDHAIARFRGVDTHNVGFIRITATWERVGYRHHTRDDVQCGFNLTEFQEQHHHDGDHHDGPAAVAPKP